VEKELRCTENSRWKVKRDNQQDATNSMFIIKISISTCFGHHYAHHLDNKTVSYCMRFSACVCRLFGLLDLRRDLCALCESYCSTPVTFTQCTQLTTRLHMTSANHSLHTQTENRMQ